MSFQVIQGYISELKVKGLRYVSKTAPKNTCQGYQYDLLIANQRVKVWLEPYDTNSFCIGDEVILATFASKEGLRAYAYRNLTKHTSAYAKDSSLKLLTGILVITFGLGLLFLLLSLVLSKRELIAIILSLALTALLGYISILWAHRLISEALKTRKARKALGLA